MSLFDSISRTLKGLLNDAADSVQDPSRDSRQIVRELDESIGKAEISLIEIQAQVATQQSKRDVAADKAKKYEDGAKRALQSGDEALAREALSAQATAEAERDALTKELATLEPSVAQLKRSKRAVQHSPGQAADRRGERRRCDGARRHRRKEPVRGFSKARGQGRAIQCAVGRTPEFRRRQKRQGARRQARGSEPRPVGGRPSRSAEEAAQYAGPVIA